MKLIYEFKQDEHQINVTTKIEGTPPGHPQFWEWLGRLAEMHARKNSDYGAGDPLGNFRFSSEVTGVPMWKGALVRLTDKWARIRSLLRKAHQTGFVKDESLEDTLIDNAVYSLLIIILKQEEAKIEENKR